VKIAGVVVSKAVVFARLMAAGFMEILVPVDLTLGRVRSKFGCSI
jgi:hypothetical protein